MALLLEPEPQAHYCCHMPRWQIALIVVGALGLGGFAAARLAHPGSTSVVGAECRRISGDRRACYTRLLTDRLASKGVADAMATLDALALRQTTLPEAVKAGLAEVEGDAAKPEALLTMLDTFNVMFDVVEPRKAAPR